jgi:hypothetical protein
MLRLLIISAFVTAGLSRPAAALPDEWSKAVMQLADATGILSSRSCRDGEAAELAVQTLSHLLHHATQTKHLDYASGRRYRRNWVIPNIRATRGHSHSSRDCEAARQTVRAVIDQWDLPPEAFTESSAAAGPVATSIDSSLPATPMLGATRSDKLTDGRSK